jgi:YHS domain-containing protein
MVDEYVEEKEEVDLVEDDEMSPEEQGFINGFENEEDSTNCAYCKSIIINQEKALSQEIENKTYLFCSQECQDNFQEDQEEGLF